MFDFNISWTQSVQAASMVQDRLIICFYEELYIEVALMQDDVKHPVVLG